MTDTDCPTRAACLPQDLVSFAKLASPPINIYTSNRMWVNVLHIAPTKDTADRDKCYASRTVTGIRGSDRSFLFASRSQLLVLIGPQRAIASLGSTMFHRVGSFRSAKNRRCTCAGDEFANPRSTTLLIHSVYHITVTISRSNNS